MSKYYILAENTRGEWAIFVNRYETWYSFTQRLVNRTCMEKNLMNGPISNAGVPYSDSELAKVKAVVIKRGMSYDVAIDSIKKANCYQKAELKHVKPQYINEHTVSFCIISENKALKLIKSLPLKHSKIEGYPVELKTNSLEERRWRNNFRKRMKSSIWKD